MSWQVWHAAKVPTVTACFTECSDSPLKVECPSFPGSVRSCQRAWRFQIPTTLPKWPCRSSTGTCAACLCVPVDRKQPWATFTTKLLQIMFWSRLVSGCDVCDMTFHFESDWPSLVQDFCSGLSCEQDPEWGSCIICVRLGLDRTVCQDLFFQMVHVGRMIRYGPYGGLLQISIRQHTTCSTWNLWCRLCHCCLPWLGCRLISTKLPSSPRRTSSVKMCFVWCSRASYNFYLRLENYYIGI